jgi:hypothetical protein
MKEFSMYKISRKSGEFKFWHLLRNMLNMSTFHADAKASASPRELHELFVVCSHCIQRQFALEAAISYDPRLMGHSVD